MHLHTTIDFSFKEVEQGTVKAGKSEFISFAKFTWMQYK